MGISLSWQCKEDAVLEQILAALFLCVHTGVLQAFQWWEYCQYSTIVIPSVGSSEQRVHDRLTSLFSSPSYSHKNPQTPSPTSAPIPQLSSVANPSPRLLVWGIPLPPSLHTHTCICAYVCVHRCVCLSARRREIDQKRKIGCPVTQELSDLFLRARKQN